MRLMAMAALLLAAGCAREAVVTPARPCDAARVQDLVGKPADLAAAEAQKRSGAASVRRYRTGDVVTMDYRGDRLNVETDAGGTIVRLSCG